ncbi:MAG: DegT/DnrJ/EryC1/StrS family aminotransferase [Bacteroidales bacterium]|nr:DegT/DnrJ/EryC1/StrS family aminotransferase [Bacteroidales bacterium]
MQEVIPFSPPRIDDETIKEVNKTLLSGWITTGPRTKLFEKKIAEFCNVPQVLCLNSATAGLELMLRWFGVKEGDEVILPAYTYAATANVIVHCGAKPVFVDINDDFNISLEAIKKAISIRTKVIMPVDLAGFPCDYDEINTLVCSPKIQSLFIPENENQAALKRILVVSDAAHSIGAVYKGKKIGSLTDVSVFSFHAVKNLTTAEGGAVCLNLPAPFNNEDVYKYLCIKSLHGQSKDALAKMTLGNWKYDIIEAGYKFNMTDIQAAIGLVELGRYEHDMLVRRREIFELYAEILSNHDFAIIPPYETADKTSSYHVFALRLKNVDENQRDQIMQGIFDRKVTVNVHFIPLPMMTFYKQLGYSIVDYPNTYKNFACEISLPVYYTLTNQQVERVANSVIESYYEVMGKK